MPVPDLHLKYLDELFGVFELGFDTVKANENGPKMCML